MNISTTHQTVIEISMPEKEATELFKELEKQEFTKGSCPMLHTIFMSLYHLPRAYSEPNLS